jgi:peptidyl-prolyl cis-trans isomerase C
MVTLHKADAPKPRNAPRAAMPAPKAVTIDGVAIPRAAISREAQHHPAAKPYEAWAAAARALVVRELLLREARRLGLAPDPIADGEGRRETDEEGLIRQVVEREARGPRATDAECRRVYERDAARFRSPDLFEVRHILLAAASGDASARERARAQADAMAEEARREPSRFAALAEAASACPSAHVGGSLGQIGPGQTVPEFEAALARIGEGETAVVETRYGVHVVRVERRVEGRALPFELVRLRIAAALEARAGAVAARHYVARLVAEADIQGIDMSVGPDPLAQ